jgi:hypothetical protein
VKVLYASCVKSVFVKVYGLLPDCCYNQLNLSDSCPRPAFRWHGAERKKKVSPTRNRYAHRRCTAHYNYIGLDGAVLQFKFCWLNKFRRYDCGDNLGSRIHGNCSRPPWHLAGCFLASTRGYEDLFREKEPHARHDDTVANSAVSWHRSVPESYSGILVE